MVYEGVFENDCYEGMNKRKINYLNGCTFEGEVNNEGEMHGLGIYIKPGKWCYEGDFILDFFEGSGKLTYDDETAFIGEFK